MLDETLRIAALERQKEKILSEKTFYQEQVRTLHLLDLIRSYETCQLTKKGRWCVALNQLLRVPSNLLPSNIRNSV